MPFAIQSETAGPQLKMLASGTLKNMAVYITANTFGVAQRMTLKKNATDTALTIPISANATGLYEDAAHSVSVSTGDLICYAYNMGPTGNAGITSLTFMAVEFVPDNPLVMPYVSQSLNHSPALGVTNWAPIQGALGWNLPEDSYQVRSFVDGTLSHLQTHFTANNQTGAIPIIFRTNGVNRSSALSIPAGGTGYFEDTTHSDVVVSTDQLTTSIVTAPSGAVQIDYVQMLMTLPNGESPPPPPPPPLPCSCTCQVLAGGLIGFGGLLSGR